MLLVHFLITIIGRNSQLSKCVGLPAQKGFSAIHVSHFKPMVSIVFKF